MSKDALVFLLSDSKDHYNMVRRFGYEHVLWLKSSSAALNKLKNDKNLFDNVDLVFVRDNFFEGKNSEKIYKNIYSAVLEKEIPFVEIEKSSYSLYTSKITRTNLMQIDIYNILNSLSFEGRSKNSNDSKFIVSKENKDVHILFVGNKDFFSYVESYFRKQGFEHITCMESMHKASLLKEIGNYDLVITENMHLSECVEELGDSDHPVFVSDLKFACLNNTNSAAVTCTDTVTYDIEKKLVYTIDNLNKLYQLVLNCVLEEYSSFNDNIRIKNVKAFNEVMDEYIAYCKDYTKETDRIRERLQVLSDLEYEVRKFMLLHMKREDVRTIEEIRFERLEDSVRVSFIYEDAIIARVTFYNNGRNEISPYYKEFKLELSSNKGNLMDLGMRCIYDDRDYKKSDVPRVLREDEFLKIDGLYKKVKTVIRNKKNKRLKLK